MVLRIWYIKAWLLSFFISFPPFLEKVIGVSWILNRIHTRYLLHTWKRFYHLVCILVYSRSHDSGLPSWSQFRALCGINKILYFRIRRQLREYYWYCGVCSHKGLFVNSSYTCWGHLPTTIFAQAKCNCSSCVANILIHGSPICLPVWLHWHTQWSIDVGFSICIYVLLQI